MAARRGATGGGAVSALGHLTGGRRRPPRGAEIADGAVVGRDVRWVVAPGGRVVLGPQARLGAGARILVGADGVLELHGVLDEGCRITAHAGVLVEAGAHLGAGCALVDTDHVAGDPERPVREQGLACAPIRIGAGATLGPGVVVVRGVTVAPRATVLAHSVVTRDVATGASVAGTPARAAGTARPPR